MAITYNYVYSVAQDKYFLQDCDETDADSFDVFVRFFLSILSFPLPFFLSFFSLVLNILFKLLLGNAQQ